MNVLVLGGSKHIGYHAASRLLKQGATVTFLLRSTSVFDNDELIQPYIKDGQARLVSGDGLKADDVRNAWQTALASGQGKIDLVLFTIGGIPSFSITKGLTLNPPDLCTRCLLNLLTTIPDALRAAESQPRFVVVTSAGITSESHTRIPLALRLFSEVGLVAVHADKLGAEHVLAHCGGIQWTSKDVPSAKVLPEGWKNTPDLFKEGELRHLVIIRPTLLTDGACRGDEAHGKDKAPYRAVANQDLRDGYRVSRQDTAHFIVNDLMQNWSKWEGSGVVLSY